MFGLLKIILLVLLLIIYDYIPYEYKTDELITLLFTVSAFSLAFYINSQRFKFEDLGLDNKETYLIIFIFLIVLLIFLLLSSYSMKYIMSIVALGLLSILKIINTHTLYNEKFKEICDKENNSEKLDDILWENNNYFLKDNFGFTIKDKNTWQQIISLFVSKHKKESYSLIKKNNMLEKMEYISKDSEATISNILSIKHYISLFHTLQGSINSLRKKRYINSQEDNYDKEAKLLANIVFKFKMINYNINILIANRSILKIASFLQLFIFSMLIIKLAILAMYMFYDFDHPFFINFIGKGDILFQDVLSFSLGIALLFSVVPFSYLYYTHLKLKKLKIWIDSSHTQGNVIIKNLFYYIMVFLVSTLLTVVSISLLSHSGVEYNQAFIFISSLFLPIMDLNSIPAQQF